MLEASRNEPLKWTFRVKAFETTCWVSLTRTRSPCPVHDPLTVAVPPSPHARLPWSMVHVVSGTIALTEALLSCRPTESVASAKPELSERKNRFPLLSDCTVSWSRKRVVLGNLV